MRCSKSLSGLTPYLAWWKKPESPRPLYTSDVLVLVAIPPEGGSTMRLDSEARLPSRFGDFRVVAFTGDPSGREHLALIRGEVRGRQDVPVRLHSECLTGDVLGSLRCDCRDQLIASLQTVGAMEQGIV